MKGTIKFIYVILVLVCMLCGCSNDDLKTKTADDMKEYFVQNKYWNDTTCNIDSSDDVSTLIGLLNNNWTVAFYDYGKNAKAFDDAATKLVPVMADEVKTETKNANYKIYEHYVGDIYAITIQVDNTLLSVAGPQESKDDIISFAKKVGYYPE